MFVVLGCVALAVLIIVAALRIVRREGWSMVVVALSTLLFIASIGGGIKLAYVIGDSMPVVITENTYNIQNLDTKPGYLVKEVDVNLHTLYIVQIDGKEVTYSSNNFDNVDTTCDRDQNWVKIVEVNTGREAVWLYAFAVDTSDLTINTDSCKGIWHVN